MTTTPKSTLRRRWQVGVRTFILLTAAVAVWTSYAIERRRIADLTTRIDALKPLARELVVDDPSMIAVVKQEEYWYDENRWEVHLPVGRRYRLGLATREIDAGDATPLPRASAPLASGRRAIALAWVKDRDAWRIDASCDGKVAASATEPSEWYAGTGSTGGSLFSTSRQVSSGKPVVLFRRRFMGPRDAAGQSTTPAGPTEGVVLWIEPDADAPTRPPTP